MPISRRAMRRAKPLSRGAKKGPVPSRKPKRINRGRKGPKNPARKRKGGKGYNRAKATGAPRQKRKK